MNENFALFNPNMRAGERKAALNSPGLSPEAQAKIVAESQLAASEHFRQIVSSKKAEAFRQWQSDIRPTELALLEGALAYANQCKEASVAAEQTLYAEAGLPHDGTPKTPVARRFDSTITDLKHELDRLAKATGGTLSDASGSSVLWRVFGVSVL